MTKAHAWTVPRPVLSDSKFAAAQKQGKAIGHHGHDLLSSSSLAQLPFHDKQHLMDLVQRLAEMEEKAQLYQARESALAEKLKTLEATEHTASSLSAADVEKAQAEIKRIWTLFYFDSARH